MPAKKNYGTTRRTESATGRSMPLRMAMPLAASSRSDVAGRSAAALARAEAGPMTHADAMPAASMSARLPLPLRDHAQRALSDYFANLDGHRPARLYDLVIREVEEPLFRAVLDHCDGNQSRAATILGINRGTLRKKLRELGLAS